jgi:hypothetical protein
VNVVSVTLGQHLGNSLTDLHALNWPLHPKSAQLLATELGVQSEGAAHRGRQQRAAELAAVYAAPRMALADVYGAQAGMGAQTVPGFEPEAASASGASNPAGAPGQQLDQQRRAPQQQEVSRKEEGGWVRC